MISISVDGLEDLYTLYISLMPEVLKESFMDIVEDELYAFAKILYMDPNVPREYSSSLSSVIVREMDTVVLTAYSEEQARNERFSSRLKYAIYTCPKRKYFGGELTPEYSGPDYLAMKWEGYKNTFINNVRSRIVQSIREEL